MMCMPKDDDRRGPPIALGAKAYPAVLASALRSANCTIPTSSRFYSACHVGPALLPRLTVPKCASIHALLPPVQAATTSARLPAVAVGVAA
jgi:hypothetical protein